MYAAIPLEILYVAKHVAKAEFMMLGTLMTLAFILKFIFYRRKKQKKILSSCIEKYLLETMQSNRSFNPALFKRKWRDLQLILPIINKYYINTPHQNWPQLCSELLHTICLPLARKKAYHNNLLDRSYSVEVFLLAAEPNDSTLIKELIIVDIPLITINAGIAAIKYEFKDAIWALLDKMSELRWIRRTALSYIFKKSSQVVHAIIVEKLKKSDDPYLRAACYNALTEAKPLKIDIYVENDILSNNLELKISALKFLVRIDSEAAIPFLRSLLNDSHWEVRLICINRLAALHVVDAINDLEVCLNDNKYPVRISAAKAIYSLTPNAMQIFKTLAPDLNLDWLDVENTRFMLW